MRGKKLVKNLTRGAIIAAAYVAVTVVLYPISFGPIQCRLSEALTVLPVFTPAAVWGLSVGCALSNLFAVLTGTAVAGVWDILFGTLATLFAALLSRLTRRVTFRRLPLLSTVFPVVINAAVLGAEFTFMQLGCFEWKLFGYNALCVGVGQAVACIAGGLLLYTAIGKTSIFADETF